MKRINYLYYFYVIYLIVWPPINLYLLPIDTAGRIGVLISFVVLYKVLANDRERKIFFQSPATIWLVWIIYALGYWLHIGINTSAPATTRFQFIWQYVFTPYLAMVVSSIEIQKNERLFIMSLFYSFFIFMVVGLLFSFGSGADDPSGRSISLLGNSLPLIATASFFVASIAYHKKYINSKLLAPFTLIIIILILLTATRKAMGAFGIMMIFFVLSEYDFLKSPKKFLQFVIAVIAIVVFYNYIMDHTLVGERILGSKEQGMMMNTTDNKFLDYMGDRAIFYIEGWELFLQHPLTGVGLSNFPIFGSIPYHLHTEYMVQLCETGIIGSGIFVCFYVALFIVTRKERFVLKHDSMYFLFYGWLLAILFISFTAWTYTTTAYFINFGLIIGYYLKHKKGRRLT